VRILHSPREPKLTDQRWKPARFPTLKSFREPLIQSGDEVFHLNSQENLGTADFAVGIALHPTYFTLGKA